ncbi:hypothetical protein [Marisediminicola senii]|uniref:hypothetical protein n=1 Tax=Marisediminicola senii TaxID=2711233 RepID=UPI0013EAA978|nr:hypothetical protein [Marisediminicola senii]
MPSSRRWDDARDERGSASLEFLTTGMVLLLPIVYLVLVASAIQGGALAVEGAARQAARVFVQSEDAAAAQAAAQRAVDVTLADYGLEDAASIVEIECSTGECLARRGSVTVTVRVTVPLPLVPPVLDLGGAVAVPLQSSATQQVSRFWGSG